MVTVLKVKDAELQVTVQGEKNAGKRILFVSPAKIVKGVVTEHTLITI